MSEVYDGFLGIVDPMPSSIPEIKGSPVANQIDISEPDMVNHPPHYQSKSGLEVIDVIDAFTEDLTGMDAVCTGNAIKYILRWKQKNGVEDIKKAIWYLNKLVSKLEKETMK